MYVARFTTNPEQDIERGWSGWMGYSAQTPAQYIETFIGMLPEDIDEMTDGDLIEWLADNHNTDLRFDNQVGEWRAVHHDGLSCWSLNAETIDAALIEATSKADSKDIEWAGFGRATVGTISLVCKVDGVDDLYIFECDDVEGES